MARKMLVSIPEPILEKVKGVSGVCIDLLQEKNELHFPVSALFDVAGYQKH
jgi:hypothetical protein